MDTKGTQVGSQGTDGGESAERTGTSRAQGRKPTSKDRRHAIRKRAAMRPGQYAAIVLGRGLGLDGLVDGAGLIRVTPEAVLLYRPAWGRQ